MAYTFYKIAAFSGGWHQGQIGVELVSQNVAGNYSVLNLIFQVKETTNATSYNNGGANMFVALDGTIRASNTTIDFRTYTTGTWYTNLTASNVVVYHGSDGNKTISLQGYCATGVGAGTYNQTQSIALPQITQRSTIATLTPTVDVDGTNAVALTITRPDVTFTHTVTFSIGTYSQQYTGVATSQSFAIPTAWLNSIPTSISGTANCRVETFSGATSLGYVDGAFTITVPATTIPVITDIAFARDTTGTDPFTDYAKGYSKIAVSGITTTNLYSAWVTVYDIYIHLASAPYTDGIRITSPTFVSAVLPWSGAMRITAIATDSRGRVSAAYYETFTAYDYFAPALTVSAFRCNASGVADTAGEYLSATMTVNVAPVNNDNTKTYVFEFKKTTDSTWTAIDTSALSGYSGTLNAVRSASSTNAWEVRASITDKISTATKSAAVLSKRVPINCGHSGTAVSIGKVAETADLFEVDMASQFNKLVSVTGGQIKFPATQVPSTDVNTLDDYEEFTYTPVATTTSGSLTTYTASASGVKIGKQVTITFKVILTNAGTGAGHIILNTPYAPSHDAGGGGVEIAVTGSALSVYSVSSAYELHIMKYDGSTIIATGRTVVGTLTYITT